jgi:hypothetical protein
MPSTPRLSCGALSTGSYCARHRRVPPQSRFRGKSHEQRTFRKRTLAKTGGRCAVPGCSTPTDRVVAHRHRHHQEVERRLRR